MKPTDEIKEEHRIIGRALSVLADAAQVLEAGAEVPAEFLREELDFIKNFADRCHHRKEEAVLFPALEDQMVAKLRDPVPKMLAEHEEARAIVRQLNEAVERYAGGDREQAPKIARLARSYLALLIEHIRAENTVLVELVETTLPADKKLEVAERFTVIEDELGPEFHRHYAKLADKLHDEGKRLAA